MVQYFANQIQAPDFFGAMERGRQVGKDIRIQNLAKQFEATGDRGIIQKMAGYDPARAQGMQGIVSGQQKQQEAFIGKLAAGVLQAPEGQRQAMLDQGLQMARQAGIDTAGFSSVYDANTDAQLKAIASATGNMPKEDKLTEYQRRSLALKESELGIKRERESASFMREALSPSGTAKPKGDTISQLEQVEAAYNAALTSNQPDSTVKRLQGMTKTLQKKADKVRARTQKYSDKIGKGGLGELVESVITLDSLVGTEGDVPGVGQTGFLPNWTMSEKGKTIRQEAQGLANIILKARSGGAITPSEQGRYYKELGLTAEGTISAGFTDADFRRGVAKVKRDLAANIKNLAAGAGEEAINLYKEQGGTVVPGVLGKKQKGSVQLSDTPQVRKAKEAGYSDKEITQFLASQGGG